MSDWIDLWTQSSLTSLGFFWKAFWAFVMGYAISAMIQTFVPKGRLTRHMGQPNFKSTALATLFGAASSSCSFAALAAARSLLLKGAHFIAVVAFMFASTNLVIELGILILVFLGWQFLVAELIGGLVLISISALLIRLTYPKPWLEAARNRLKEQEPSDQENFSPLQRMTSREGWVKVGQAFVGDWKMVWQEILIGFAIAGMMKVFVPTEFWQALFLKGSDLPGWLVTIENAAVAPFVAAATFIGSMGNIPLATVLSLSGVSFAGVMGFIYSDLMVPPLVKINAKYYGLKLALYIAGVMWVSIVATALILDFFFGALGVRPEPVSQIAGGETFALDYTFWLNLIFTVLAFVLVWLARRPKVHHKHHHKDESGQGQHAHHQGHQHHSGGGLGLQSAFTLLFAAGLILGLAGAAFGLS